MINNMSFKVKLLLIFLIPLVAFAFTSMFLLNQNSSDVKHLQETLYETSYKAQSFVLNADRDMYQAMNAYQSLQIGSNPQAAQQLQQDFNENVTQVEERIQNAMALLSEEEADIYTLTGQSISELLDVMSSNFKQWATTAGNNIEQNQFADDSFHEQFTVARSGVNEFGEILETYVASVIEAMDADNLRSAWITFTTVIVITVLIVAFGIYLLRNMNKSVRLILKKTSDVAQGNLQLHTENNYAKDELGQILYSVDGMIVKMRELIGEISSGASSVAAATTQLSTSADESYKSTAYVASHIDEVNTQVDIQATVSGEVNIAMEEMAIGIQKIAESTTSITEIAERSNTEAEQGSAMMQELKLQMQQMLSSIKALNERVNRLNQKSGQIGAITENISSIATQTSILSLNASIEAARAGEAGRGFAVVAEEIRKLAANALASASSIAELIDETRNEIQQATLDMNSTVEQGSRSGELVEHAAHGFQEIVYAIRDVSEQLHDTSSITEQMSASSEEISASMAHTSTSAKEVANQASAVALATKDQLQRVQHINDAASSLQSIVGQLNQAVNQFRLH